MTLNVSVSPLLDYTYISSVVPPPDSSIALIARFAVALLICFDTDVRRMLMFVVVCDILKLTFDVLGAALLCWCSFNMRCSSFRSLFNRSSNARCFFLIALISDVSPLALCFCFCNSSHAICPLNRSIKVFSRIFSNVAKS